MRAFVRFELPDGQVRDLGHGDLVGRLWSAALHVDDPSVSEAHALVSLRGSALKLLALRGRFAVDGRTCTEVELVPGLRVALARGVELAVVAVELPASVPALEGDGLPRQVLTGSCALVTRPRPALVAPGTPGAVATFWSSGAGWRVRIGATPARDLSLGEALTLDGTTFRVVAVPTAHAATPSTRIRGGIAEPLRIVARYDTVHIHRRGRPVAVLDGIGARVLSELASCRAPLAWEALATDLWRDERDRDQLRNRWDAVLVRLRRRLRDAGVRADLVRSDGAGHVELCLQQGDQIVDQT